LRATRAAKDPRFIAATVMLIACALLAGMNMGSDSTSAAIGPKRVQGFVWDLDWNPIPNANVTVESFNGAVLVKTMYIDATEPDGFYQVTFINSEWDVGFTFKITAKYLTFEGVNSTLAAPETWPYQWLNASITDYEIPEFGDGITAGLTVAGLAAVVVTIASRRRRVV
jgi:hypothetical protein